MPKWLPSSGEIMREAIIVLAGALIATIIVRNVLPAEARQYFNLTGSNNG